MGILEILYADPERRFEGLLQSLVAKEIDPLKDQLLTQKQKIKNLEKHIALVSMICGFFVKKYVTATGKSEWDILKELSEIDLKDKVKDNGLHPERLARMLGIDLSDLGPGVQLQNKIIEPHNSTPVQKSPTKPQGQSEGRPNLTKKPKGNSIPNKAQTPSENKPLAQQQVPKSIPSTPVQNKTLVKPTITAQEMLTKYKKPVFKKI